jgi:hypothetical protein
MSRTPIADPHTCIHPDAPPMVVIARDGQHTNAAGGGFRNSHRVFSEARSGVDWWGRCYFTSGTRERAIRRR